jgi:hypothetical protein
MKLNTVNVTEYADNTVLGITSFSNDEEGIKEAEAHFSALAKEQGVEDSELDAFIEDGYYEQGDYQLFLNSCVII